MKKFIFLILFLGLITKVFACKCVGESIAQRYLDADIVALVTVEKTYGNKDSNVQPGGRLYSADLKFEKIYKGVVIKKINIFGTKEQASSGACEKYVEKGERYLILLSKNRDGEYYVSSCSTMPRISEDKFLKEYENVFKILERNKSKLSFTKFAQYEDSSEEYVDSQIKNDFMKLDSVGLKNKVGIYKVKINNEGRISAITPIAKVGIREKEVQKLMMKNLIVHEGLSTTEGEYFIILEL